MIKIDIMSMDKKPQNARLPTECSGVLFYSKFSIMGVAGLWEVRIK